MQGYGIPFVSKLSILNLSIQICQFVNLFCQLYHNIVHILCLSLILCLASFLLLCQGFLLDIWHLEKDYRLNFHSVTSIVYSNLSVGILLCRVVNINLLCLLDALLGQLYPLLCLLYALLGQLYPLLCLLYALLGQLYPLLCCCMHYWVSCIHYSVCCTHYWVSCTHLSVCCMHYWVSCTH